MNVIVGKDACYLRGLSLNGQGHRWFIPRELGQQQSHAVSALSTLKINVKSCHYVHATNSHGDLAGGNMCLCGRVCVRAVQPACVFERLYAYCTPAGALLTGHILTIKQRQKKWKEAARLALSVPPEYRWIHQDWTRGGAMTDGALSVATARTNRNK